MLRHCGSVGSVRPPIRRCSEWLRITRDNHLTRAALRHVAGGLGLLGNRALSGVAAVADASSSQSRTDVICLALAACLLLTGLQWASLKSKAPRKVRGSLCWRVGAGRRIWSEGSTQRASPVPTQAKTYRRCSTRGHRNGQDALAGAKPRIVPELMRWLAVNVVTPDSSRGNTIGSVHSRAC